MLGVKDDEDDDEEEEETEEVDEVDEVDKAEGEEEEGDGDASVPSADSSLAFTISITCGVDVGADACDGTTTSGSSCVLAGSLSGPGRARPKVKTARRARVQTGG